MSLLYSIKEGLEGFRRARLASFVSISIVAVSLILVGTFLVISVNMTRLVRGIQKRMSLEVFIDNTLTDDEIATLENEIRAIEGIYEVEFISKEKAAQTFKEEFGENIFEILDENPLPSSFRLALDVDFRGAQAADAIVQGINELKGVTEVVYRAELFRLIDRYIDILITSILVIGILILLGSLIVISNTIRIIIHSKRAIIAVMKLVGATPSFIRRPYLVEGMVQGMVGGGIAALILFAIVKISHIEMPGLLYIENEIYGIIILIGIVFGWFGSLYAVRRLLRY